jgi:hypothetical protein
MTDYKDTPITWQAYAVMQVDMECLSGGKYPNGQRLTAKDRIEIKNEIADCKDLLLHYGCELPKSKETQLTLFA